MLMLLCFMVSFPSFSPYFPLPPPLPFLLLSLIPSLLPPLLLSLCRSSSSNNSSSNNSNSSSSSSSISLTLSPPAANIKYIYIIQSKKVTVWFEHIVINLLIRHTAKLDNRRFANFLGSYCECGSVMSISSML
jgi:hypothetical protein